MSTPTVCPECGGARTWFVQHHTPRCRIYRAARAASPLGIPAPPTDAPPASVPASLTCGKPAASFRPRVGESFACVLNAGHGGECRPGGECFTHGRYVSAPGQPPFCPKCQRAPVNGSQPLTLASAPCQDGRTHYEGCWTEHHDCARYEVERLRSGLASRDAEIARLREDRDSAQRVAMNTVLALRDLLDRPHNQGSPVGPDAENLVMVKRSWYNELRALAAPPDTTTETPRG